MKSLNDKLKERIDNYIGSPEESPWDEPEDRRWFMRWLRDTIRLARLAESEKVMDYIRKSDVLVEHLKNWKCTGFKDKELKRRTIMALCMIYPSAFTKDEKYKAMTAPSREVGR